MKDHKYEELEYLIGLAQSYRDLAQIALMYHLPNLRGRDVHQVCGPISDGPAGSLHENLIRFRAAIEHLKNQGLEVFDQLLYQNKMAEFKERYPSELLEVFYRPVFESGVITRAHFLSNWQDSKGAIWERGVVTQCGIEIVEFDLCLIVEPLTAS